jgi:hypothetical protein
MTAVPTIVAPINTAYRGLVPEQAARFEEAPTPLTDLKGVHLFIGIPSHGAAISVITATALVGLAGVLDRAGIAWHMKLMNGEMVARARNRLAKAFLNGPFTHLLFIDSDIGFEPLDVLKMLAANMRAVGGIYALKEYAWDRMVGATENELPTAGLDYCYNATGRVVEHNGEKAIAFRALRGCIEVGEIGTGFLLIQRETLELFAAEYPKLSYAEETPPKSGNGNTVADMVTEGAPARITTFFDYGIHEDRYLSEDFFFCRKWRDIGGRVWCFPEANLSHAGVHVFAGKFDRVVRSAELHQPAPIGA